MIIARRECAGHRARRGVQADPGKFHEFMSQSWQSGVEPGEVIGQSPGIESCTDGEL